jgi:hypothetical protein
MSYEPYVKVLKTLTKVIPYAGEKKKTVWLGWIWWR